MSIFSSSTLGIPNTPELSSFNIQHNAGYLASCAFVLGFSVLQFVQARKRDVAVPAVGPAGLLISYYGAMNFITNARAMLQEGYDKFKSRTFKVPQMRRWLVIVNTPELIDEVSRAPEDRLSFVERTREAIAPEFILGRLVAEDRYHIPIVRTQLTRNISGLFDNIKEEIELGFEEGINAREWVSRPALSTVMQVVGRASNRVFVGLPLCRNKDYLELNVRFIIDVMKAAQVIRMFPGFMKGIVGELLTSAPASTRRGIKHFAPIIEYRLKQREKHGDEWPGKPNDMLSWLIDEAPNDKQRSVEGLTQRILTMNFAAIHTSSNSFTHALLHLAAHPEYIAPMREEAERVIESDGWTKLSMQKMRKIDSFLKESMRFNGLGNTSMTRKALVDYKLSDGTVLSKGSFVSCNALAMHRNDGVYADASEFRPFRFADLRDESAEEATRHQLVSTSNEFLTFGHRRHACPGQFFAANELKAMMAYFVLNYDIKLPDGQDRPKDLEFEAAVVPNPKAHVLFRKRQT